MRTSWFYMDRSSTGDGLKAVRCERIRKTWRPPIRCDFQLYTGEHPEVLSPNQKRMKHYFSSLSKSEKRTLLLHAYIDLNVASRFRPSSPERKRVLDDWATLNAMFSAVYVPFEETDVSYTKQLTNVFDNIVEGDRFMRRYGDLLIEELLASFAPV